jgi:hypothetical protein
MAIAPFQEQQWHTIGQLRAVADSILCERKADPSFSAKLRTQYRDDLPWAKSWNEELFPLKVLADHKGMSDDATFCWTPSGAADFEVRTTSKAIKIQSTMAYAEREGTIGKQGAHVHKLEMIKSNADGFCFSGGLVTKPRAPSPARTSQETKANAHWRMS